MRSARAASVAPRAQGASVLLHRVVDAAPQVAGRARLLLASFAYERRELQLARRLLDSVDEADLDLPDSRSALQKLRRALQPVTPAG